MQMNLGSLFVLALAGFGAVAAEEKKEWKGSKGYGHGKGKGSGSGKTPNNFIMVIPDGFGPASEAMARGWTHWSNNDTTTLPIDSMVIGQVRTRATDSYVTDSAASATAYSCGLKSYNGAIGVVPSFAPCGTVLEAAKAQGMHTGLIATSRITHATPASYVAHVYDRDLEANIALQEIGYAHPMGRVVDLLLGGGRCFFTPQTTEDSCREDDIDALALARDAGYQVFSDRETFDGELTLPYLGLFTQDHMSYEIDRNPSEEPSLAEMAIKGLDSLLAASQESGEPFFIMVEASRIDHAGHANDATGHLHDILAYNEAMAAMREWIDEHAEDAPTTLISTADHECGGLTIGTELDGPPEYWWAPEHFAQSTATAGVLAKKYAAANASDPSEIFAAYGIPAPTADERAQAVALQSDEKKFAVFLAKALSDRLGINWSTAGHTGVDVTLYGYGGNSAAMVGQHENTQIGEFVAKQLGLDLEDVTEKLAKNETWLETFVKPPTQEVGEKVRRRGLAMHHH
ncbi:alkaline-phosphatase-like protein [Geopyxis carbonaria]|nr:alkaline-phosphatase-like protein [Geopyxis carbonaria]